MNVINIYKWILIIITLFIMWANTTIKEDYKKALKVNILFIMYLIYLIIS